MSEQIEEGKDKGPNGSSPQDGDLRRQGAKAMEVEGAGQPLTEVRGQTGWTFSFYQMRAHRTAIYPQEMGLAYLGLGLAGEAGEVANKIKKLYRDGAGQEWWHREISSEARQAILEEMGGCLWYLAEMAGWLRADLGDVAAGNLAILDSRLERGTLKGEGDAR